MARSLFDVWSDELNGRSTPITSSVTPLSATVWPRGFAAAPKSWVAVSGPSTMTECAPSTSLWSMNRPDDTERERTVDQAGIVPVNVVVQFVEFTTSDADDVDTGATVWMSGATDGSANAVASCWVSVEADPNPPRAPVAEVELP